MGIIWFGIALLIMAAYAVVQVSRWAAQDSEGRVEMLLSAPVSRTRVVIERVATLLVAAGIVSAVSSVAVYVAPSRPAGNGRNATLCSRAHTVAFAWSNVNDVRARWVTW